MGVFCNYRALFEMSSNNPYDQSYQGNTQWDAQPRFEQMQELLNLQRRQLQQQSSHNAGNYPSNAPPGNQPSYSTSNQNNQAYPGMPSNDTAQLIQEASRLLSQMQSNQPQSAMRLFQQLQTDPSSVSNQQSPGQYGQSNPSRFGSGPQQPQPM